MKVKICLIFALPVMLTACLIAFQMRTLSLYSYLTSSLLSTSSSNEASSENSVPIPIGDPEVKFWITGLLAWHDAHRHKQDTRREIFSTIGAGLGYHIKALVRVYGCVVLTLRLLIIDWTNAYRIESVLSARSVERYIYTARRWLGSNYRFAYRKGIPTYMLQLLPRNDVTPHTPVRTDPATIFRAVSLPN